MQRTDVQKCWEKKRHLQTEDKTSIDETSNDKT